VKQQYLPDELLGATYFAAQRGVELELARRLDELKRRSDRPSPDTGAGEGAAHDGASEG